MLRNVAGHHNIEVVVFIYITCLINFKELIQKIMEDGKSKISREIW